MEGKMPQKEALIEPGDSKHKGQPWARRKAGTLAGPVKGRRGAPGQHPFPLHGVSSCKSERPEDTLMGAAGFI